MLKGNLQLRTVGRIMISMLFVVSISYLIVIKQMTYVLIATPINETVDIKLSVNGACLE